MGDFTFLNVSQLIYYDDDEYFLLLSFLNTPLLTRYNQGYNSVYWILLMNCCLLAADADSTSLGIRGVYRGTVCCTVVWRYGKEAFR